MSSFMDGSLVRALTALSECPAHTWWLKIHLWLQFKGYDALFWCLQVWHAFRTHVQAGKTLIHTKITKCNLKTESNGSHTSKRRQKGPVFAVPHCVPGTTPGLKVPPDTVNSALLGSAFGLLLSDTPL